MSQEQLTILAFGCVALVTGAVGLLLRDLFVPGKATTGRGSAGGRARLRRTPGLAAEKPQGLFQKADYAFDRLILETDNGLTPVGAFLVILISGLVAGGCVWLYLDEVLPSLCVGILGMVFPVIVLVIQRGRRMREIRDQMPHVLDMLARAARAGQSSEQAIELAGQELDGRLAREFQHCSRQLAMGRSFFATMSSLAERIRTMEIRILTTTLIVQKRTGGNLAETLERMAGVIRDRLNAARQMRASTGAGRASTLLVATIAPLAYVVMFLFQRSYLQILFDDPIGRLLLGAALVLEVLGLIWVAALLRSE